ncbi:MAG: flagellar motor switch protein FliN [Bdellovibrionales bacterium]|jgi:flagellar motor switch protein FliN/FliY|nr:flagellar motor switch protein FliN [Bdellovibrionales bacterium]
MSNDPNQTIEFEEVEQGLTTDVRKKDIDAIYDIPVQISAVLGKSSMQVSQLLKLGRGAVVELDRKVGEAIDIYVNNRLVARGEVIVVEDRLGVTMTEIVKSDRTSG